MSMISIHITNLPWKKSRPHSSTAFTLITNKTKNIIIHLKKYLRYQNHLSLEHILDVRTKIFEVMSMSLNDFIRFV